MTFIIIIIVSLLGKEACERTSFVFLRKELPVRLANIMKELHLLPNKLLDMPSVELVQSWYERSFEEILNFEKSEPESRQILESFCDTLVKIRNRHSNVVETMAHGIMELKQSHNLDQQTEHCIQYFLNRFYMSRISIRMLINQHAALFGSDLASKNSRNVGVIDPNVRINFFATLYVLRYLMIIFTIVQRWSSRLGRIRQCSFLMWPVLFGFTRIANWIAQLWVSFVSTLLYKLWTFLAQVLDSPITIVYTPSHLYHILFELFKNAMRAVVELHGENDMLPPIKITIVNGKEDLTIKVSWMLVMDYFII